MQIDSLVVDDTHYSGDLVVRAYNVQSLLREMGDSSLACNSLELALSQFSSGVVGPLLFSMCDKTHPSSSDRLTILVISPAMLGAICLKMCVGIVSSSHDLDLSWFMMLSTCF